MLGPEYFAELMMSDNPTINFAGGGINMDGLEFILEVLKHRGELTIKNVNGCMNLIELGAYLSRVSK